MFNGLPSPYRRVVTMFLVIFAGIWGLSLTLLAILASSTIFEELRGNRSRRDVPTGRGARNPAIGGGDESGEPTCADASSA